MVSRALWFAILAVALVPATRQAAPARGPRSATLRPPLAFEHDRDTFTARLGDVRAELLPDRMLLRMPHETLSLRLVGASAAANLAALDPLPGVTNYLHGNDPAAWRTGVAQYRRLRDAQVYPGIDLVYYGTQDRLEHDFVVAPHANPAAIEIEVAGSEVRVTPRGDAVLGAVTLQRPVAYQERAGARETVAAAYVQHGDRLRFEIGAYDHERPLVIDPIVLFSFPLGGNAFTQVNGVAQDAAGNIYTTGFTQATDFPVANAAQPTCAAGCGNSDAFLTVIDPTGTTILYSTYFGGSSIDQGFAVAVDGAGNAYLTGTTSSADFPVKNAFQATVVNPANTHAFVAKLDTAGALVYSTYLAGSGTEDFNNGFDAAIAVDASGAAYVAGSTTSTDFPTLGAFQATRLGTTSGYVTKLAPSGSALVYSTYLGGTGTSGATGIAVDSTGAAYVTGNTTSSTFPTTAGALSTTCAACASFQTEAFVTKLAPGGAALVYSTFLGDAGGSTASGIAIDGSGSAYVAGTTSSKTFPTVGAVQPICTSCNDARSAGFASKLNAAGSALVYSTFLTAHGQTSATAIAVDASGRAYIAGATNAPDFPSVNAAQQLGGLGISVSSDGGPTIATSNRGFASAQTNAVAADLATPTTVYAATLDGVFKSTDSGTTWAAANNGLPVGNVQSLAVATGVVLVGIATKGVFRSTDGAASFSPTTGLPGSPGTIGAVAFDPTNASIAYAGIGAGPILFKSVDGGASWTSSAASLPAGGSFFTVTGIVVDPTASSHVFLSSTDFTTPKGVFASTDGGATWVAANTGLNTLKVNALAVDSAGALYAGTDVAFSGTGGGVFKSIDGAAHWTQALAAGGFNVEALASDAQSGFLFAGLQSAGLVSSSDHGATWSTTGLSFASVTSIAVVKTGTTPAPPGQWGTGSELLAAGFGDIANVENTSYEVQLSADGATFQTATFLGGPLFNHAASIAAGAAPVVALNLVQPLPTTNFGTTLPGNNVETLQGAVVKTGDSVADIGVTKTVDRTTASVGELLTYTITVTNMGPDPAVNVETVDKLDAFDPSDVVAAQMSGSAGVDAHISTLSGWAFCRLSDGTPLAVGASFSCTIKISSRLPGDAFNSVIATTDSTDNSTHDNTATTDTTITQPGAMDEFPFTFAPEVPLATERDLDLGLTNSSASDALVTSIAASCSAGVTCAIKADTCSGSTVLPGQSCSAKLAITAHILGPFTGSVTVVNNTTGSPQIIPINGTAVNVANLSAMDFPDHATVSNGDTVTYTLVATNNGPSTATNPKLVDTLQTSVDFSTVQFLDGTAPNGGTVVLATDLPSRTATCTIQGGGQLAVGEALRCRFTVQATGIGASVNTVLATNDLEDPADTGNTGSASTFIQVPPPPTFAPSMIALGSTAIGASSAKAVVATNPDSTVFLNVKSIAASCGTSATCTITPDTCTGARVAPLAICGFTVHATCTSTGPIVGFLSFSDFSTASTASLPISGTCVDPTTITFTTTTPSKPYGIGIIGAIQALGVFFATPTGMVTIFDGTTSLGTATLSGGMGTFTTPTTLAVGGHDLTAVYGGDAIFAGSTSAPLTVTVTQATSTTTLVSSANPSGLNQAVTFTATVPQLATGTVTFVDGATTLGTGSVSGGSATFQTSSLAVGAHAIVAKYGGDGNFASSDSTPLQQTVSGATDYGIAANPATLTIPSGATASTTLTITPTGGFAGAISLSCTDLPADASCGFAPATVMLDGSSTPKTAQLTLSTEAAMVQARASTKRGGLGALLLFGTVGVFARRRRGWLARVLLLFGFAAACGGDAGPQRTPAGTYAITVAATGSMNHSTTISVVVE